MQMIMLLLGLFVIGCMLYGITAGVQVVQRGLSRLANSRHNGDVPAARPAPVTLPTAEPDNAKEPPSEKSPFQRNIGELREIFALYQQGGLTQEEFQDLKHHLLTAIQSKQNIW